MREILFKAKTTKKDNPKHEFSEKWVEGNLILYGEKAYIHPISNKIRTTGRCEELLCYMKLSLIPSASTQDLPTRTVGGFGRMIFVTEKKNILKL